MRLSELQPRWIHQNVFIFLCPHCKKRWLSCKNVKMSGGAQVTLFRAAVGDANINVVVPTKDEFAWNISTRDFETMTVTPSIDASPSGDWHGHIKNGAIV